MSGQPNNKPTDASKFREQYLAELAQQIANDDKNLQANKIYKKTGQTPSIVLDTRTSGEKLADKQRLKIEIRRGLSEIMDGSTAERVVQEMDDDALEFLAQRLPEIVSILKPKYKYGVPLVNFMTFMMEYIKSTRETGDYLAGNQATSGKQVLMGIRQILGEMINKETLGQVADALDRNITGANIQIGNAIRRDLVVLASAIPTKDELERIVTIENANLAREIQKQLSEALEELPTTDQIRNLLNMLNRTTSLRDSKHQEEILLKLHELLTLKPEVLQQIQLIRNEIGGVDEQIAGLRGDLEKRREEEAQLRRLSEGLTPQQKAELRREMKQVNELPFKEDKIQYIDSILKKGTVGMFILNKQSKEDFFKQITGGTHSRSIGDEKLNLMIEEINNRIGILTGFVPERRESLGAEEPAKSPLRKGNGIRKGRGVKGGNIADLTGVVSNQKLVPFGKYFINARKLGEDIITIKRPSGQGINEYPSRRVSKEMGEVMRKIVGGGQPEFSQLEKLSDDEKIYLKNLVKKSDIGDRLTLITPNKDDDDKDIHAFEVMKGEILSGNDNVDLVKKFKILILKLLRKELLPRNQGKDLLLDLATLGY